MPEIPCATPIVLPPLFCPPLSWFALLQNNHCIISEGGPLQKQSLLNRCWIKTAQGAYALTIPLLHTGSARRYEDTYISYHENWPLRMLRTLNTNYRKSAYYEYYFPELEEILRAKPQTLSALNHSLIIWMCRVFHLKPVFSQNPNDFRLDEVLFPPKPSPLLSHQVSHFQLYGEFIPGLSALDVLFHYGPDGNTILGRY
jgi:hypothetical protein